MRNIWGKYILTKIELKYKVFKWVENMNIVDEINIFTFYDWNNQTMKNIAIVGGKEGKL